MTVIEMSLATIAVASAVVGLTAALVAVRLQPLARNAERLLESGRDLLVRLERITDDAEAMLKDARRVEHRIARSADLILDQVEPPLRVVPALMSGLRAGVAALFTGRSAPSASPSRPPSPSHS